MHFDQRTQAALREVGLDADAIGEASALVTDAVDETARELAAFFDRHDVVHSDMDMAHAATPYPEHEVEYCDLTTHAADIRGWLRFDSWGAYVEDGRVLKRDGDGTEVTHTGADGRDGDGSATDGDESATDGDGKPWVVELSLGPTIHDRVRFAPTREALE